MNTKTVFYITGKIIITVSVLMFLPVITAICYNEIHSLLSFLYVIVGGFAVGFVLTFLCRKKDGVLYAKDGFIVVTLAWIASSVLGAMPFVVSGEIPSFTNAFFETVSGFTTTGASILTNVEAMSKSMLFWRSFTHFIGGMGIIVFVMALIPAVSGRSIHILRAEMPGPTVDKIMPKAKDTAKILYLIYIGLAAAEAIMLLFGGMPLFDSLVHTFGTAGTGGFGIKANSIAGYSNFCQWVIAVFMVIFGINFNVFYLLLIKRTVSAFKSSELWTYLGIIAASTGFICLNIYSTYEKFSDLIRDSFFQVSTIISTTGFSTVDFDKWPTFSKALLLLLMVTGACAGSTAGGIKISRVVLLFKIVLNRLKLLLHPRAVCTVKVDKKTVDPDVVSGVTVYAVLYFVCIIAIFLILCIEKSFDIESNLSATLACFNNIGPGLAIVGPTASYAGYSALSKWVLSVAMLMGRLEIFPILLFLSPSAWKKAG
ncbi:MAG: TrkH family potassium uptake protein [Clostridia bacterium]|nr:TrkH family potassium uptake protein [Clostridia bacterium]